ncbi:MULTISPECIES: TIGR03111 family XrtG-associated glycosyltransferase [Clostridium]|uniref:TIGR03111 family XrtG-associated glycosyltransferase n=1 Tax=Clostridium TaxID=1485 RepID=UPI001FAA60B7|nr:MULTISPECIES: TIGR03111 family XrtG-associated glycosyltransferase [Clostridium]MDU4142462.1 putative glycosyltransferase, exosortase G system-associated [Clostridium sp.]
MDEIIKEFVFWGIWLVIPLIIDFVIGIVAAIIVSFDYFTKTDDRKLSFYPYVTILIPVYNSEKTLCQCVKSIVNQSYPISNLQVLLIDNGSKDESYRVYCELQQQYPKLRLWWLDSSKGKAKALNKGLYMADGKYIINIDSDGVLEKDAIFNMVYKFEKKDDVIAMTGVVLTNYKDIDKTNIGIKKVFQKCELFEYSEAFLIGRGFQSKTNTMFTLAGAFSAFRRDSVLRTQLYNGETLGEDTHMTSQIRAFLDGRVELCEDSFFFVDPVENLDKLYIQRQRWQRGQIEVSTLFSGKNIKKGLVNILKINIIKDHTLVFPRLIWIFALIFLIFIDYPMKLIVGANLIMYLSYVLLSVVNFIVSKLYLKEQKDLRRFMNKNFMIVFLLPIYRIVIFFMRVAGILNSTKEKSHWNTKTFNQEKEMINERMKNDYSWFYRIKSWVNCYK